MTRTNVTTGNKLILYVCKVKENIEKKIECVINLLNHFKSLQYGPRRNVDIIGVPYLSKQLHRMEIKVSGRYFLKKEKKKQQNIYNIFKPYKCTIYKCHISV